MFFVRPFVHIFFLFNCRTYLNQIWRDPGIHSLGFEDPLPRIRGSSIHNSSSPPGYKYHRLYCSTAHGSIATPFYFCTYQIFPFLRIRPQKCISAFRGAWPFIYLHISKIMNGGKIICSHHVGAFRKCFFFFCLFAPNKNLIKMTISKKS